MATIPTSRVFIDTNILVYSNLAGSPFHQLAIKRLTDLNNQGFELWISRQILREYLAVMMRPIYMTGGMTVQSVLEDVRDFENTLEMAEDNPRVTQNLLVLLEQAGIGGYQVHDANIVATMQAHNITQLLTNNAADFNRFSHLISVLTL